ncbi:MAG TPA: YncE family protein [Chloroflexota bacterium]|nr:YncE family protein [Chloroflexota bacterium]
MKVRPRRVRLWLMAGVVIVLALVLLGLFSVLRVSTSPVLRTVTVGQFPWLAVVDPAQGRLFVANTNDGTMSVLNVRTGRLLHTTSVGIQAGQHIWNMAADAPSGHVFVRTGDDVLTTLDARSGAVVRTLSLQPCSQGLAADTRLAHLFVGGCDHGIVQMIDARSGRLVASINVGGQPKELAVDEQTGRVFVLGGAPGAWNTISLLDAASGRVLRTFTLGADLCLCITTPLPGGPVFVDDDQKSQLYVLDATSGRLLRTVKIGMDIYDHAVDAHTGRVFLVGAPPGASSGVAPYTGPGRLVVLDGRSGRVVRRLTLSAPPSAVALDARGQRLLLGLVGPTNANTGQPAGVGSVEVRDAHSLRVLRAIPAGIVPWTIVVDTLSDHAFVVNANIVPTGNNPSLYPQTSVMLPEEGWPATLRRLKRLAPWLPLHVSPPPGPSVNGSVTVLDLARV